MGFPDYERLPPPLAFAGERSLDDVHSSISVNHARWWRRLFSFSGPAFMVSVGYMDPGNWATDLQAGSQFGYRLIWVILLSNLMAILLQTLSARLGIVSGRDLAQACRDHYPAPINLALYVLCEIAIAACDLAEVLGSAIGLKLLFGIPLLAGVLITAFDVLLLLFLQSYGIRKLEAFILTLVATIGLCFAVEMVLSRPAIADVLRGFIPTSLSVHSSQGVSALYIAIGIIGATVMPHNLYLHSALVQSRAVQRSGKGLKDANWFNLIDSVVALNAAFFVNAAILILAAAAFFRTGHHEVGELEKAHALLEPLLGSKIAPAAFAIALLAAGQSSTITGTLAGQIVMEGFMHVRLRPWLRRLVTRALAIIPAVAVILWKGDSGVDPLLVFSQVILSLQLSFAIVPLIHFTSDRKKMGDFVLRTWARILAWIVAAAIMGLNLKLIIDTIRDGFHHNSIGVKYCLLPAAIVLIPLLLWMILEPFLRSLAEVIPAELPMPILPPLDSTLSRQFRRVAIALEATPRDEQILASIIPLVRATGAQVLLIHVVESATARFIGQVADDVESRSDEQYLRNVAQVLKNAGLQTRIRVGQGEPENEIARIAKEEQADLIVTGAHGHKLLGDLFHGSTVSELRHLTVIPVLTVRTGPTAPPSS
jgi:manganese transport protein